MILLCQCIFVQSECWYRYFCGKLTLTAMQDNNCFINSRGQYTMMSMQWGYYVYCNVVKYFFYESINWLCKQKQCDDVVSSINILANKRLFFLQISWIKLEEITKLQRGFHAVILSNRQLLVDHSLSSLQFRFFHAWIFCESQEIFSVIKQLTFWTDHFVLTRNIMNQKYLLGCNFRVSHACDLSIIHGVYDYIITHKF